MLPACFIFFLVMGLVMLGVATPTEAAATGVAGAFVLSSFSGGLLIMCCAIMFSQLLTFAGAPQFVGELVRTLRLPSPVMIFLMLAIPFFLHILLFLDQVALLFILVPIYKPILAV
jgi:TRAP-type mannitol/chloroaromatic compound transport system permease large subunit